VSGAPNSSPPHEESTGRNPRGERPCVVVYTHSLLGSSMTFIASHAEALRRYQAVYAGSRRVEGLVLPGERAFAANTGGPAGLVREFLFRRAGHAGRLGRELRRFRPRLVHAHFGQSGPAGLILADALGIPLVVTYHGQDATITEDQARRSWRGREFLRGKRHVMDRAARIIAVSDFIRSRLVENGYPARKIVTHRNGIDLEFFRRNGQARQPIVVFVGRFVEKKGAEFLVRALGLLRAQGVEARGILIGDGPLRPDLERIAGEVGADAVFAGFLPPIQVKEWLAKASVAAVPSVTASDGNSEGLPTVILEAQAMGTPVVATRHAGNAEGVDEGRSAILVDERDVEGLAEAIRTFVQDPARVESFGNHARRVVEARFSIGNQVTGLEKIYDEAWSSA
jgi:colanic acid/amylovoran biosynthesis glycosyltransferase